MSKIIKKTIPQNVAYIYIILGWVKPLFKNKSIHHFYVACVTGN